MNKEEQSFPKRPRIKDFSYQGYFAYFITICTDSKKHHFNSAEPVNLVIAYLKEAACAFRFQILAYCFMPDHFHFLAAAEDENSSLKPFLKDFKQKSGYYFKQRFGYKLWQPSYYDHVLRKRENINKIAEYIFYNPVRKKIVDDYHDYPYLGSMVFDL